jgi:antibiotic biosynthesis monooxygenase (ABM) superfamily enzyme
MQEGSKVQTMCTTILNTYNVKPSNLNFNKVWIFYQHKKKKQMKIYNV